jgi:hypothetical protein
VGFDFGTGAGLVNAEAAVGALRVGSCGLFGLGVYWDACLVSDAARILDSCIGILIVQFSCRQHDWNHNEHFVEREGAMTGRSRPAHRVLAM